MPGSTERCARVFAWRAPQRYIIYAVAARAMIPSGTPTPVPTAMVFLDEVLGLAEGDVLNY